MTTKRSTLFNPLTISGIVFIGIAIILIVLSPMFFFLSAAILASSVVALLASWIMRSYAGNRVYWPLQIMLTFIFVGSWTLAFIHTTASNRIVFPKDFSGGAAIIFGMKNYPPLPSAFFWRRTITIPESGVLITSTLEENIVWSVRLIGFDGEELFPKEINWDANGGYPTLLTDQRIKYWAFGAGTESDVLTDTLVHLANQINEGKKASYYSMDLPIIEYDEGPYLNLMEARISRLPKGLESLNLHTVNLTGNGFTSFPEELVTMPTLKRLNIGHNPIKAFPENLEDFKQLERLSINVVEITRYPEDLSALANLESLGIDHNKLTEVPAGIGTLPKLTSLNINDNELTSLRFLDSNYAKLEVLNAYSNNISELSCALSNCSNLRKLLVFDNQIDSIPDCIGSLIALEKLEIWSNPIRYISPEIARLTALHEMRLDGALLSKKQKEDLKIWLPNCTINFQ